jgi:hypothetical protein
MGESIKEECLSYFVTKETFNGLLKYLLPIIGFFMAGAFAYGWNEIVDRSTMKSTVLEIKNKQVFLSDSILTKLTSQSSTYVMLNEKLDALLRR